MESHQPVNYQTIDWRKLKNALKTGGSTRLYAFRAHIRGKMHFAPNTNLALRCWKDGVPCRGAADATLPGGWTYKPITTEMVEAWVQPLYRTFAKDVAPSTKCGIGDVSSVPVKDAGEAA